MAKWTIVVVSREDQSITPTNRVLNKRHARKIAKFWPEDEANSLAMACPLYFAVHLNSLSLRRERWALWVFDQVTRECWMLRTGLSKDDVSARWRQWDHRKKNLVLVPWPEEMGEPAHFNYCA